MWSFIDQGQRCRSTFVALIVIFGSITKLAVPRDPPRPKEPKGRGPGMIGSSLDLAVRSIRSVGHDEAARPVLFASDDLHHVGTCDQMLTKRDGTPPIRAGNRLC